MRKCQGGHDVPDEKLRSRFNRTLANLKRAIQKLPHVIVFSNDDLNNPYKFEAMYENGQDFKGK
jgi:predicted ABC-type ATPase